jgi:hypothetical protein
VTRNGPTRESSLILLLTLLLLAALLPGAGSAASPGGPAKAADRNVLSDPSFFPLAVWCQDPVGEGRTIPIRGGDFGDDFAPYEVHIYRVPSSN